MRNRRIIWAGVTVVLFVAFAAFYFYMDPMEMSWMPKCLWKVTTGTDCPGCGSQRMAHALMHGDFRSAWRANAYAVCMLPVLAVMLLLEFSRERLPRLYRRFHSPAVIWTLAASLFVWWIARNLD